MRTALDAAALMTVCASAHAAVADVTVVVENLAPTFLLKHPGRPFSRGELLQRVWGEGFDGYEHTVNSHINRLRSRIEDDPRNPQRVVTVWGVGYRFDLDPAP